MAQAIDIQANPIVTAVARVGRNDRCPCDSGKKYKKCCELLVFRGKPGLIVSPAEWEPLPEGVRTPDMVCSSLSCEVSQGDISVAIAISRYASEQEWILMVQNDRNGMRIWDDRFPTEEAALEAGLRAIQQDGIEFYAVNLCDYPVF